MIAFDVSEAGMVRKVEERPADVAVDGVWNLPRRVHSAGTLAVRESIINSKPREIAPVVVF
jgi:hypothetical protein